MRLRKSRFFKSEYNLDQVFLIRDKQNPVYVNKNHTDQRSVSGVQIFSVSHPSYDPPFLKVHVKFPGIFGSHSCEAVCN